MNVIPRNTHHVEHLFQKEMLEKLWEPITIAGMKLKNRIALAPIGGTPQFADPDIPESPVLLYEAMARGGTGLIVAAGANVSRDALPGEEPQHFKVFDDLPELVPPENTTIGIWTDDAVPRWAKLIKASQKWGAKVFLQLSASPEAYGRLLGAGRTKIAIDPSRGAKMTPKDIKQAVEDMVNGALNAKKAGADGVSLFGTADSLIAVMVSERRNPGTPGYCEGFKERLRFPTECIREIKAACGKDFPVMIRLSPAEHFEGGYDVNYAKLVAKEYVDAGIDIINSAQAGHESRLPQRQMTAPSGSFAYLSRAIKDHLTSLGPPYSEVAIMATCRIDNPWQAASMLRAGDCDVVSLCKQHIADQYWANKIREGRIDDIVPCIACCWCFGHNSCSINPQTIRGYSPEQIERLRITKAEKAKRVLVAGGGQAGMEAARTLALRGHKVTLYEKEEALGKMLHVQGLAPERTNMDLVRKYLSTQVRKLGVDVRCNQEATAALVEKENPDSVIVATGCRPKLPQIAGINSSRQKPKVVYAEDVLLENVDVGKKVVVIDADEGHDVGSLGALTAQFIAKSGCLRDDIAMFLARWNPHYSPEDIVEMAKTPVGKEVTLVTRRGRIADIYHYHFTVVEDLRRMGVRVLFGCEYKEINDEGLVIVSGGREELLEADTIITAQYESNDELYKALKGKVSELHLIGDAKAVELDIGPVIHQAHRLALRV